MIENKVRVELGLPQMPTTHAYHKPKEGEAVVVLGCDHEVLSACFGDQIDPFFRVVGRCGEVWKRVVIGPVFTIGAQTVVIEI